MAPREKLTLLPERIRLPRGRTALPESEVATSQRGRILQAVVEEVAERGYQACSVQDIIRRAQVSRSAFYGSFHDKRDAFAVAHRLASQQLLDRVAEGVHAVGDVGWRTRHRAGVGAYLDGFIAAPAYAVAFMVELPAAGSLLLDQRDAVIDRYVGRAMRIADAAALERPAGIPPSRLAVLGVTEAAHALVIHEIRAGRLDQLDDLLDPIVEIQLPVIAGR